MANLFTQEGFFVAGVTPAATQTYATSVADALTATGTNLATGLVLTAQTNVLSSVPASTAVTFDPSLLVPGATIVIRNNDGANAVLVFAGAAVAFDGGSAGGSVSLAHAATGRYLVTSATQVRTV